MDRLGRRLCGHEGHYARSKDRIEVHGAANPGLLHPGYAYPFALEGDLEGLTDFLEAVADARQPITPFVKLFSTQILKLGIADAMKTNDRYPAVLTRLAFPDGSAG